MQRSMKDLKSVFKELKALTKKTEELVKVIDTLEKAQAADKRKARVRTARKAPTKKASAKRKITKLNATDQVLKVITRTQKGVDVLTLMKKTRFSEIKVHNIITRAYKEGKIKRVSRGIYVTA